MGRLTAPSPTCSAGGRGTTGEPEGAAQVSAMQPRRPQCLLAPPPPGWARMTRDSGRPRPGRGGSQGPGRVHVRMGDAPAGPPHLLIHEDRDDAKEGPHRHAREDFCALLGGSWRDADAACFWGAGKKHQVGLGTGDVCTQAAVRGHAGHRWLPRGGSGCSCPCWGTGIAPPVTPGPLRQNQVGCQSAPRGNESAVPGTGPAGVGAAPPPAPGFSADAQAHHPPSRTGKVAASPEHADQAVKRRQRTLPSRASGALPSASLHGKAPRDSAQGLTTSGGVRGGCSECLWPQSCLFPKILTSQIPKRRRARTKWFGKYSLSAKIQAQCCQKSARARGTCSESGPQGERT